MNVDAAYNEFYQLLYGGGRVFKPPAGLHHFLRDVPITSQAQLESLFVLYNAALSRNPLNDRRGPDRAYRRALM